MSEIFGEWASFGETDLQNSNETTNNSHIYDSPSSLSFHLNESDANSTNNPFNSTLVRSAYDWNTKNTEHVS